MSECPAEWEHDLCDRACEERDALKAENKRYKQALEAIWFGSLEANFKQCLQTPQEIAKDALEGR